MENEGRPETSVCVCVCTFIFSVVILLTSDRAVLMGLVRFCSLCER